MVLLRFAPSPTGPLHLGGLRMALYNYLYVRRFGGKWILRVEDTDVTRTVPGSVDGIRNALEWAGLEYDYGPDREGPHGPYFQSERLDLYRSYTSKLLSTGHAYRCFCSPDTLSQTKERLARSGSNETYDKRCQRLTEEEVARRVKAGEKSIVRINDGLPPNRPHTHDLVFGSLRDAHLSLATDPVLLKSDGFPTYHLANVVDDHEMGITHVLRGEEWLPSLPLHLDLYSHLNLKPPQFAHIPILLNPDRTKMSKRHGDVQVVDYIRRGWEPEAILNWLALSSWGVKYEESSPLSSSTPASSSTSEHSHSHPHPEDLASATPLSSSSTSTSSPSSSSHLEDAPDSTHLMSLSEMIASFDITALTHRSSVLDPGKLEYINKHHLIRAWSGRWEGSSHKDPEESAQAHVDQEGLDRLARKVHDYIKESFPSSPYTTEEYIKHAITLLEGRLTNINDIPIHAPWLFVEPDLGSEEASGMIARIAAEEGTHVLDVLMTLIHANGWETFVAASNAKLMESLNEERRKMGNGKGMKQGAFMGVIRWALTGMKNGPGVIDVMRVLGHDRVLGRLGRSKGVLSSEKES